MGNRFKYPDEVVVQCTCKCGYNTIKCFNRKQGLAYFLACSDCKDVFINIVSLPNETDSEFVYDSQ